MKVEKGMQIKVTNIRRGSKGKVYTVVKVIRKKDGLIDLWCNFHFTGSVVHYFNNIVEDGLISPFDDEIYELLPIDKPVQRTLF